MSAMTESEWILQQEARIWDLNLVLDGTRYRVDLSTNEEGIMMYIYEWQKDPLEGDGVHQTQIAEISLDRRYGESSPSLEKAKKVAELFVRELHEARKGYIN